MKKLNKTYWLFWVALLVLSGASLYMALISPGWSPSMEMRTGLGFAEDVSNPAVALGLADDADTFLRTLGFPPEAPFKIAAVELAQKAPLPDIEQDTLYATRFLEFDKIFIFCYVITLSLLSWHLVSVVKVPGVALGIAFGSLLVAMGICDWVENSKQLSALKEISKQLHQEADQVATKNNVPLSATGPEQKGLWSKLKTDTKTLSLPTDIENKKDTATMVAFESAVARQLNSSDYEKVQMTIRQEQGNGTKRAVAEPDLVLKILKDEGFQIEDFDSLVRKVRGVNLMAAGSPRAFSKGKWICTFVLYLVLGFVMVLPRRDDEKAPWHWLLAGTLLMAGGVTGLVGVLQAPICIEPGFQFGVAAFVVMTLAGFHRLGARASLWWKRDQQRPGLI